MEQSYQKEVTVDGNTAAAYVAYAFTETAAIYPITPSSAMAESVEEWSTEGRKNIFGQQVQVVQMQSEAGAAGAFHGALQAGVLTTTFTASQGLLLMIPNIYKAAGELLPGVIHVSARAIAAQALSIFGDHQDVMAVRQTGCVMLCSSSVQETADLAAAAHMSAVVGRLPFIHFFDGFRTSHEISKIKVLDYKAYEQLIDKKAVCDFRDRALSPNHPVMRGTAQNPDIYFQTREASNVFYEKIPDIVCEAMDKLAVWTGRKYDLFDYYGDENAENIIIAMGSVCETIAETVDYLLEKGEKVGVLKVRLFRPFSAKHFLKVLPKTVKKAAVLDRTKEPGALGEPLYLDVRGVLFEMENPPLVVGGRYGLGSKDTTPAQIMAVYENLKQDKPKNHFTIGIVDDVTQTSLEVQENVMLRQNCIQCKFWGLGSDGTVGANKQAIKIIGQHTDNYVQGYFSYDSKKSGGLTISHLRFGKEPIRAAYLIQEADYIACHNASFLNNGYDLLYGLKENGIFVLNCQYEEGQLEDMLSASMKRTLSNKNIRFYCINAVDIAAKIGLGNRINMIMQGAFFKLTGILPEKEAVAYLKETVNKAYGKKGKKIVEMNEQAVEAGFSNLKEIKVPKEWGKCEEIKKESQKEPPFVEQIMRPMEQGRGDLLSVGAFSGIEDGTFPSGTTAYEKRGIGISVPEWIFENCIQCNLCSYICPHSCIRPFLLDKKEKENAPKEFETLKAAGKGLEEYDFRIQVSPMDCTGCGNCADVCPAKDKALVMKPLADQVNTQVKNWAYAVEEIAPKDNLPEKNNVKMSQFAKPLMEFSGACGGCGETPYIKLATQLFGERMMIANATGCSSIWGASAPSMAYTVNHEGKGPAWANSLFEDNAEFGYGMYLGTKQLRRQLAIKIEKILKANIDDQLKEALTFWLEVKDNAEQSVLADKKVKEAMKNASDNTKKIPEFDEIKDLSDYFVKRSQWIIGGDGWAYDIGFSGLDHVLASGADVNVLVFDTEIYSNTGGQASKATPLAAHAKFAAGGKIFAKKNLAKMMMTYENIYVAQIAMGADKNQTIKAFLEAESYNGPSLIIAYAPCISHGIKEGMGRSMANMAQAVEAGYWNLFRYNPQLKEQGKEPFILDSKKAGKAFKEYLAGQVRFMPSKNQSEKEVKELYERAEQEAKKRFEQYKKMAE